MSLSCPWSYRKFSFFYHEVWWVMVFHKLRKCPSIPTLLTGFIMKGLDLANVYYVYSEIFMCFFLYYMNRMYYPDWFLYTKLALHFWDTYYLDMVCIFLICCKIYLLVFFENFCVYICKGFWSVPFFPCDLFVSFWYQDNTSLIEWVRKYFLFCCLEKFVKDLYYILLKCLVYLTSDAIWFWIFLWARFPSPPLLIVN